MRIIVLYTLTLISCGTAKIYKQDNYKLYENQLSKSEKEIILTKKEYFKTINLVDKSDTLSGELRIILNQQSKFEFVEIGNWYEHLGTPKNTSATRGPIRRISKFDSLATLSNRKYTLGGMHNHIICENLGHQV